MDACLNGNGNIFKEIKKLRKCDPKVATSIDGVKSDISDHFRKIPLYFFHVLMRQTSDLIIFAYFLKSGKFQDIWL